MKNILSLIFLSLIAISGFAQQKIIKLKNVPLEYRPQRYYIANIVDERADTGSLGTMRAGLLNKIVEINLANGVSQGLYEYIRSKITPNQQLVPVTMHIKELVLKESAGFATERADLNSNIQFSTNGDVVAELTYSGYAVSGLDVSASIGKLIGQMVEYNLKAVDDYLAQNITHAGQPTDKANITVEILSNSTGSQLAYSRTRPLTRNDFAGEVDDMSRAGAVTYSGIYAHYSFQKSGGITKYKVTLLPYFEQSKSWWADKNANNVKTILAHEQLHFDITAYFTCILADRLKKADFSNNAETVFQEIVNNCETERNAMQSQYDKETKHGMIAQKQAEWIKKMQGLMATVNCL